MRLIDKDTLIESLKKSAPPPTTDDLYEVNLQIINAPTIDAIPVEWLENMLDKTAVQDVELNNAIFQVLVAWTKEQVVR